MKQSTYEHVSESTPEGRESTSESVSESTPEGPEPQAGLQRLHWHCRLKVGAFGVVGSLLVLGCVLASNRIESSIRSSVGGNIQADRRASHGNRTCVELPNVKLADGEGGSIAAVKKVSDVVACRYHCAQSTDCKQAIYASDSKTCTMFASVTPRVVWIGAGHSSMYCGKEGDYEEAHLKSMKRQVLGAVRLNKPTACSSAGTDCRESGCCSQAGNKCYVKSALWASCQKSCPPDDNANDSWSCDVLGEAQEDMEALWGPAEKAAREHIAGMPVWTKANMLHGNGGGGGYAGTLSAGDWQHRLTLNDGPQGYNAYTGSVGMSTQFPCLLSVAASWNPSTSWKYANAVAEEFVAKGANVLLGPDIEVIRAPLSGRSFETISGEDPYLGSQLVAPYIKAVMSHGIITTVKHWIDNNMEIWRQYNDVTLSERAQHEIYTPVFKAAFQAGAGAVMCAYNKVFGEYNCQNYKTLTTLLRDQLGFRGFVMSDWGATHSAEWSAKAGLDVEMPKWGALQ